MKKIGIICFMAIFALLGLNSCGGAGSNSQDKAIADKIENGEDLTHDDYSIMINYVGEFAKKAQPLVVATGNEAAQQLAELKESYPYLEDFRECIKITPLDKFDAKNLREIGEYAGYDEFSAPMNYTIQTDPEAAGVEVASPDSANGVIAGGVDTVKIKK